jgi:hypothetical protein
VNETHVDVTTLEGQHSREVVDSRVGEDRPEPITDPLAPLAERHERYVGTLANELGRLVLNVRSVDRRKVLARNQDLYVPSRQDSVGFAAGSKLGVCAIE